MDEFCFESFLVHEEAKVDDCMTSSREDAKVHDYMTWRRGDAKMNHLASLYRDKPRTVQVKVFDGRPTHVCRCAAALHFIEPQRLREITALQLSIAPEKLLPNELQRTLHSTVGGMTCLHSLFIIAWDSLAWDSQGPSSPQTSPKSSCGSGGASASADCALVQPTNVQDVLDALPVIPQLRELQVAGPSSRGIPGWVAGLQHLHSLRLRYMKGCSNVLSFMESWLDNPLPQLKALSLPGGMTLLPAAIGKLTSLKRLDIMHHRTLQFPGSFGDLQQLRELHLPDVGACEGLVGPLARLECLEELHLSAASCAALQPVIAAISGLPCLRELAINCRNTLDALPGNMDKLQSVEQLTLYCFSQPSELSLSMDKLKKLSLQDPRNLQSVHVGGCRALAKVDFSFNAKKLRLLELPAHPNPPELFWEIVTKTTPRPSTLVLVSEAAEVPDGDPWLLSKDTREVLMQVHELRLRCNGSLQALPAWISDLKWLKVLDCSSCSSLASLGSVSSRLENLDNLVLPGSCMSDTMAASISGIRQLHLLRLLADSPGQGLNASVSHITTDVARLELKGFSSLPEPLGMPGLRRLVISSEQLQELPLSVGSLQHLEQLELRCPMLKRLPDSIGNCSQLELLDLTGCFSLEVLPGSHGGLLGLKKLHLCSCPALNAVLDAGQPVLLGRSGIKVAGSKLPVPVLARYITASQGNLHAAVLEALKQDTSWVGPVLLTSSLLKELQGAEQQAVEAFAAGLSDAGYWPLYSDSRGIIAATGQALSDMQLQSGSWGKWVWEVLSGAQGDGDMGGSEGGGGAGSSSALFGAQGGREGDGGTGGSNTDGAGGGVNGQGDGDQSSGRRGSGGGAGGEPPGGGPPDGGPGSAAGWFCSDGSCHKSLDVGEQLKRYAQPSAAQLMRLAHDNVTIAFRYVRPIGSSTTSSTSSGRVLSKFKQPPPPPPPRQLPVPAADVESWYLKTAVRLSICKHGDGNKGKVFVKVHRVTATYNSTSQHSGALSIALPVVRFSFLVEGLPGPAGSGAGPSDAAGSDVVQQRDTGSSGAVKETRGHMPLECAGIESALAVDKHKSLPRCTLRSVWETTMIPKVSVGLKGLSFGNVGAQQKIDYISLSGLDQELDLVTLYPKVAIPTFDDGTECAATLELQRNLFRTVLCYEPNTLPRAMGELTYMASPQALVYSGKPPSADTSTFRITVGMLLEVVQVGLPEVDLMTDTCVAAVRLNPLSRVELKEKISLEAAAAAAAAPTALATVAQAAAAAAAAAAEGGDALQAGGEPPGLQAVDAGGAKPSVLAPGASDLPHMLEATHLTCGGQAI